jgi:hypothetical protein
MNYYIYKNEFFADGDLLQVGDMQIEMTSSVANTNPESVVRVHGSLIKKGCYYKCEIDGRPGFEKSSVYFASDDGRLIDTTADWPEPINVTNTMAYNWFKPSDSYEHREYDLRKTMNAQYKRGCTFIRDGIKYTSTSDPIIQRGSREIVEFNVICFAEDVMIYLFSDEKQIHWPDLVDYVFVTTDEEVVRIGDKAYEVTDFFEVKPIVISDDTTNHEGRVFFHAANALKIKEEKSSSLLKSVEDSLLKSKRVRYDEDYRRYTIRLTDGIFYTWLKEQDPHAYWRKVLEVIAETLNGGWKPKWGVAPNNKYVIYIAGIDEQTNEVKYKVNGIYAIREDLVYFKSREAAKGAINVLGSYLKFVFSIN